MSNEGDDLAADLKTLADTLLARLGPVLRQATAAGTDGTSAGNSPKPEWQGCSWCPVCAIAAVIRGEQHDLVTLLTVEGAALIAIIRDFLAAHGADVGPHAHTPSSARPRTADSSSSWPDAELDDDASSDAAASGSAESAAAPIDARTATLDPDASSGVGRQPTSRSRFIPITVTTTQSPTEDRSRP